MKDILQGGEGRVEQGDVRKIQSSVMRGQYLAVHEGICAVGYKGRIYVSVMRGGYT